MIGKKERILIMTALILCSMLMTACGKKKDATAVSGNETVSQSETAKNDSTNSQNETNDQEEQVNEQEVSADQDQSTDSMLDVTSGTVGINLASVSDNIAIAKAAKEAMASRAYFTGSNLTVNDCLTSYGEGAFHAIVSKQNDICVFYEGDHNGIPFQVDFVVYEDGTFTLESAQENQKLVEDYVSFVEKIAKR
ncbi:MAG: hypothetical protein PHY47_02025 [Lachnospiraceae bacterium]|nr:hypothetical protein [Lachnospiraceae bacterium]